MQACSGHYGKMIDVRHPQISESIGCINLSGDISGHHLFRKSFRFVFVFQRFFQSVTGAVIFILFDFFQAWRTAPVPVVIILLYTCPRAQLRSAKIVVDISGGFRKKSGSGNNFFMYTFSVVIIYGFCNIFLVGSRLLPV